jgi:hypothetical protein
MGSLIRLQLGNFEVDWGKNILFLNHAPLFQADDFKNVRHRYVDGRGKKVDKRRALVKPMSQVLRRLELLGHTMKTARESYEALLETGHFSRGLTFDEFAGGCAKFDCGSTKPHDENDYSFGEFASEEVIPRLLTHSGQSVRDRRELGDLLENLDPNDVLRLLAENPKNLRYELTWNYADVVDEGSSEQAFAPSLSFEKQFLVVTEGSSDSKIIRDALQRRRPEIQDFFYFIDMQSDYPFTGVGNLHKFVQGLAKIKLLNGCLILYDNDAEGNLKFLETSKIKELPPHLRVIKLPDEPGFRSFATIGPSGLSEADINGRAASIECYLDLRYGESPKVRWTNYLEKAGVYQGRIEDKERLVKDYFAHRSEKNYNFSKLDRIVDLIVSEAISIAEERLSGTMFR